MAAISVAQATVRPGKVQEYLAIVKEVKQLGAKHGLSSRLFVSQLAGPAVGTYSFVAEAADLAALATGLQKFFRGRCLAVAARSLVWHQWCGDVSGL